GQLDRGRTAGAQRDLGTAQLGREKLLEPPDARAVVGQDAAVEHLRDRVADRRRRRHDGPDQHQVVHRAQLLATSADIRSSLGTTSDGGGWDSISARRAVVAVRTPGSCSSLSIVDRTTPAASGSSRRIWYGRWTAQAVAAVRQAAISESGLGVITS